MIDICVNVTGAWTINASELQWRGIAALVLCDRLEAAGYRVRVTVGAGSEEVRQYDGKGGPFSLRVTVKDHDMPVDVATAAAISIPAFFRVPVFAWIINRAEGKVSSGICSAAPATSNPDLEPGEIVIGHDVRDERTAMALVSRELARLDSGEAIAA